ncbi:hypothetical protein STPYR_12150 [uncultured Stenotrophomonas sp.]|uniref:ATP-dependent helicase HrpB n=1 Tax=uncultured Stenotrophomonas sp. TaxID=165438 RepID=A0A1Y5Q4L1_9GAMM|nr:hypothetical protein STPYR_12150 [uncultured Stenotrophomonas sp.]
MRSLPRMAPLREQSCRTGHAPTMSRMSSTFPISPLLPAIADSLTAHPRLVLEAPPGAGKTTQVPLALLDAPWLASRRIVMLEPRRVAARSAAQFMAKQLGEAVGETVGYRIRFENKVSARTRIEVVTEGILTRMLQDDPLLENVGALLFDEFHERHLSADLGLALALDVQAGLREDLRIVVMSATLDGERLATFLDAPRLSSEGRSFPVEVSHFPARRDEALEAQARRAVEHALENHPGDVLVFLPGQREIARLLTALESTLPGATEVLPLHGELPVERQSHVLQPAADGRRRVVLATNVAESSVTLPGVRVVVDAGLAREPRYDPNSGFSRLDAVAVSQASADQRAGRAGRVGRVPGAWRRAGRCGCGRSRSGWSRSGGRKWRRWNWPRWRWNWPRGAATTCVSSIRHRPARWPPRANCCNGWARSTATAASPPPASACSPSAPIRGWRRCWPPPRIRANKRWPPTWQPCWKHATRCAKAATRWPHAGAHWPRSAMAAPRMTPTAVPWPRWMRRPGNGAAACAAIPRRRPTSKHTNSATCSPMPFPTASPRATPPIHCATSWPTAAAHACSTTATCAANRGWWSASCATKRVTRWCCVPRRWTRHGCAVTSRSVSTSTTWCAGTVTDVHWKRAAKPASTASCWTAARPGRSIPRRPRARSPTRCTNWGWTRCRGRRACASGATACRACAGGCRNWACPTCPTRRCWTRWTTGCCRPSPARPGWTRSPNTNWAKR